MKPEEEIEIELTPEEEMFILKKLEAAAAATNDPAERAETEALIQTIKEHLSAIPSNTSSKE